MSRLTLASSLCVISLTILFKLPTVDAQCNGSVLTVPTRTTINSPDYPLNYPLNAQCQWRVTGVSLTTSIIRIVFTDFDTEANYDFVTIFNGFNITSTEIASVSGALAVPIEYSTSQTYMFVTFTSDQSGVARGFTSTVVSTGAGCTAATRPREYTTSTGTLTSPNYSGNYNDNADCMWRITASRDDSVVVITFTTFNTELCCDFLSIYDGPDTDSPLLSRLSGSRPSFSNSTTQRSMLLQFSSDATNNFIGFTGTYYTTQSGCTADTRPHVLVGSGWVSSPNFPQNYNDNANCQWLLRSSTSSYIALTVISFATQASNDILYIYDGNSVSTETLLATLSGFISVPRIYASSGTEMTLRFVSSTSINYAGFKSTFSSNGFDACLSTPCRNGGTCSRVDGGYVCSCRPGFTGIVCEINEDECASNPCINGVCNDKDNSYSCACYPGFTGAECQTEIDECASEPCVNDGTCIDNINGFECVCQPGYSGVQCANEQDNCLSLPCLNNATCVSSILEYRCVCDVGFTGSLCETEINYCDSSPCQNGGNCSLIEDGYECECESGFTGLNCETNINECLSLPCQNQATCVDEVDGFRCDCELDFTGIYCESTIDECVDEPCENGATCVDGIGDFTCICVPGFTGRTCETEFELPSTTTEVTVSTTQPTVGDACSADSRPLDLSAYFGTFSSANYPANYDNNADCQWRITAFEETGLVGLQFDTFSTEECCDFVYIYNGDSAKSPLIQALSGALTGPVGIFNSTQRYLFVRFRSDETDTDTGFTATFASTNSGDACAPESRPLQLTGYSGKLFSSSYPGDYENNADCQWLIYVPSPNGIVNLVFLDIDTESCCDVITVLDGDNLKSKLIVSLSGTGPIAPMGYNSTQAYMFVRFTSDSTVTARGFRAEFTAITSD